jgi:chromatin remodeling complex protein RSC6
MSSKQQSVAVKKTLTSKKSVATPAPVQAPVEPTPVQETEVSDETTNDDGSTDKRRVPTRDSIIESFDELIKSIESEMEALREGDTKNKGIKFLKTMNKRLKILKNQSARIIKQKRVSTKKSTNNNSGFLKPVKISTEMAKFTGWDKETLKSRVDVTKFLCTYIKDNNLQNPVDKRQILADGKLQKLLKYDPKKETEPLTYFRLQNKLKGHFIKDTVEPAVTA